MAKYVKHHHNSLGRTPHNYDDCMLRQAPGLTPSQSVQGVQVLTMAAALKHGARLRTRLPFLGVTRCCPHGSLTRSAVRTFTAADSSSVARVRPHTAPTHDASAGSHRPGRSAYAESWGFACHAQVRRCHAERAHSGDAADAAAAATTEPVDSPTAGFKDGTLVEVRWREIRQRAWPDTERRLETGGWEHPAVPRSLAELRALIPHVRNDIPALQHAVSKLKQQGKGRFLPTVQVHGLLRVACDCLDDGQDPHDVSEMLGTLSAAIGGDYPAGQDGNPQSAYIDTVLSVLFYTASKGPAGLDSVHLFVRDLLRRVRVCVCARPLRVLVVWGSRGSLAALCSRTVCRYPSWRPPVRYWPATRAAVRTLGQVAWSSCIRCIACMASHAVATKRLRRTARNCTPCSHSCALSIPTALPSRRS